MLTEIRIDNFRNLQNIVMPIKKITLLIGTNRSGKSSVLHSLLLLKQAFFHENNPDWLRFDGEILDVGSRREVVFGHDENKVMQIGFSATFDAGEHRGIVKDSEGRFSYDTFFTKQSSGCRFIVDIGNLHFEYHRNDPETANNQVLRLGESEMKVHIPNARNLSVTVDVDDDIYRKYGEKLGTANVNRFLEALYYVPVPRGIMDFKTKGREGKADFIASSKGLRDIASRMISKLEYDSDFVDKLSPYFEGIFGEKIRAKSIPANLGRVEHEAFAGKSVEFYDPSTRSRALVTNTGYGLNQTMFVLGETLDAPQNAVIMIEEPEASLHADIQYDLIDALLEIANVENKQLIISSHSEHVAFALFKAVEEGRLKRDELAVYSFRLEHVEANQPPIAIMEEIKTLQSCFIGLLGDRPELVDLYKKALGLSTSGK
jgi:predicted ATPase